MMNLSTRDSNEKKERQRKKKDHGKIFLKKNQEDYSRNIIGKETKKQE